MLNLSEGTPSRTVSMTPKVKMYIFGLKTADRFMSRERMEGGEKPIYHK